MHRGMLRIVGAKFQALLFALCLINGQALADKRVALVIGNSAYEFVTRLDNPRVDARSMREALTRLGFTVVYGEDLDKSALEKRLGDFALAVRDADVAIVYFAGHGATFGDIPYIVPVDAQFEAVERMPYELVPVEALIGELRHAKGVRIAILDACRDNKEEAELKRRDAQQRGLLGRGLVPTRGLAKLQNADGLIVAYATQYLTTASDGPTGGNSPFTGSLVSLIGTPNLDVKDMLFRVARDVIAKTGGRQRPEISVSLYDEYEFVDEQDATSAAVEDLLRQIGAVHGQASYDPRTRTAVINDLLVQLPTPSEARIRIGQLALSRLVMRYPEQFSAQHIEIKNAELAFGPDKATRIDDFVVEDLSLAPATLRLGQVVALADAASRASDQSTAIQDIVARVAEGIAGIQIGKLQMHGVTFAQRPDVVALDTLSLNKLENGKFSDLVLDGLTLTPPQPPVHGGRIALKGFDLVGVLRKSAQPGEAPTTLGQVGELLTLLDGIELSDLAVPDDRPGQAPGQRFVIESAKASWADFVGGVPTTIRITGKATIPILPHDQDLLKLLREAGQNSYSFTFDLAGRWTASSQTFVVTPAVIEFGNLFSASAILAIDNVPSNVFVDDPASFRAAVAVLEVGPIELAVHDTGGVTLLFDQVAKAQNVSVEAARRAMIESMTNQVQSQGTAEQRRFVGPVSQFLQAPGATLKIILTPKGQLSVVQAVQSLQADPADLLAQFNIETVTRPSRFNQLK